MPPLANLSVSGNVYTVSNISGPLAWEQVKDPEVIMPIHNANSWTYTSTITYASTANTGTKSWTTGVTVTPINFIGNVEGKEVIGGAVDVAVTDGFTGNVLLKSSEAVAKLIVDNIKSSIKNGGPLALLGGLLVRPALGKIKKMLRSNNLMEDYYV